MPKKPTAALFALLLVLTACVPASPTTPQPTSIPTHTQVPSATPRPLVNVEQDASLYAGPGNLGFDVLGRLAAGAGVDPLATYGEFVLVSVTLEGRERIGYVWREALAPLPASLPEQGPGQVPLDLLFRPECSAGTYFPETDQVTFENPTEDWLDSGSTALAIPAPLSIRIQSLTQTGSGTGALKIEGTGSGTGEWWQGIARLDIGYSNGLYFIGVRDGTTENYRLQYDLPVYASEPIQLVFDGPEGSALHILDGSGEEIQFIDLAGNPNLSLPGGLFPDGVVYLGTTLPPRTTLTVAGLEIGTTPDGRWVEPQNGYNFLPGLAELAGRHGLTIGTEFGLDSMSDPRYCETMYRDFNLAEESGFSFANHWLGPGDYDFSDLDRAVDYAHQRGWRVRAMHLVYGAYDTIPDWLINGQYSRDEYIALLEGYIHDVVTRYADRVDEWSIANEAPNRSFNPGADFWNDRIGPEYIAIAFRAARQADPDGILIFNEDNNESPQDANYARTVETMFATVQQLKAEGVPVDVVGMQMHLFLPWDSQVRPDKAAVIATMQRFAALGVRIYITEFDVDLQRVPGSQAERWPIRRRSTVR